MGLNFSAFEIGRRALQTNQLGITVTGQNIANANTPGYTRLQVASAADQATVKLTNNGVTIGGLRALRDQFVEARLQVETGTTGRLQAKRDALAPVDAVFAEAGTSGGLFSALSGFFSSFRDLEAQPTSEPLRHIVTTRAETLTTAFHSTHTRLSQIQTDAGSAFLNTVEEANGLIERVAELNAKIIIEENSGIAAFELRDQRSEIMRRLGELTGARITETSDGQATVSLSDGRALVVGADAFRLGTTSAPPDNLPSLTLAGKPLEVVEGKLRGYQEAMSEVGEHLTKLDQLAASVAGRVNTLHTSGSDLNGNAGVNFFNVPTGGVTAWNIAVADALKADARLVVAAANGAGSGDATVARSLANLLSDPTSTVGTQTGSYETFYSGLVTKAGAGVRSAEDALTTQMAILTQTQTQRDSTSGVSLDEEAIHLLQYQRAYEAAARFLKVADEMTQLIMSLAQ